MIIAVDVETRGLDATKYVLGCLITENKSKPEIYDKSVNLWNRVIEIGLSEARRGKTTNVYSHNAQYDTASYVDLVDKHLIFYSNRPFIWGYRISIKECKQNKIKFSKTEEEKGYKEIIRFLDTMSIYNTSLKEIGLMIGIEKIETPKELISGNFYITKSFLKSIEHYLINDTIIVLESLRYLKKLLKNKGVILKRLLTINQIAIQYMIYKLKEDDDKNVEHIFFNKKEGVVHNTFRSSDIHCAYRGGRVEAFKTGIVEGVNYIDNNGLYPFMLSNIKCPDLRSERKLWRPLSRYSKEDILKEIGISRCLLKNESNDLGLLSIRTSSQNYFPKSGKYLIGTWTNREISKALDEGYVLIDIEWTVSWKEAHNPFKRIIDELYSARLSSSSKIENWFYKMMMNASIGKMAQHRTGQEILIDDIDDARDYLKKNYEILKGIKDKYMYVKKVEGKKKKYYMPIISTIVNANARIKMYDELKKIKESDLIYSDTDSIIYTGEYDDKFIFSNKLGDFKKVYSKEDMCIYGRKTYSIGKDIKISGFNQRDMDIEDFKKGIVKAKRMITIKTTDKIKEVGRFIEESRDLNKQLINHKDSVDLINEQVLMIDYDIDDVSYFMGKLELEKKSLFDL